MPPSITVQRKDLSDGEEIRGAPESPPGCPLQAHARAHTHTQYLCQLQHHSVIHIKLSWDRLNEVSAAHRDDAEASAKYF